MHRTGRTITGIGLLVVAYMLLAPRPLGGVNTYVVTRGASMLPTIRPDDLAVARKADSYEVGDIVVYHDPRLNRLIMHRVIGRAGDRYVTKGDNNSFVDSYTPSRADIAGRIVVQAPGAGRLFSTLRDPVALFFAFALVMGLAVTSMENPTRRQRRRRHVRVQA